MAASHRLGEDPHSFANFKEAVVRNIEANLAVDFPSKTFSGCVTLTVDVLKDGVKHVRLDTRQLNIKRVTGHEGEALEFTQAATHETFGRSLEVALPSAAQRENATAKVTIHYSTTPESAGIQWIDASQTSGKKHAFVYTQGEAILGRTILPCQDTPAVKSPFELVVSCASDLVVACSGRCAGAPVEADGKRTYTYKQTVPVPAYLIAISCGDLVTAPVGPRSSVVCEESLRGAAQYEFSEDTERYIKAGEEVTGIPYEWGTYDMLILPPVFPYGGMENPNLTFLSASLICGDRSLTNVVAHEITHSWAGNLVTNGSWNDFWLNEGFTVYIERLILGRLHGDQYRALEALIGYNDLQKTVADLSKDHADWTLLRPDLTGVDPDDAFSKIPYEKGSLFLLYIETLVGGKAKMEKWLNSYFLAYRYKSVTTEQMREHLTHHFTTVDPAPAGALAKIDWDTWLSKPGLPDFDPKTVLDPALMTAAVGLAAVWRAGVEGTLPGPDSIKDFMAKQTILFLDELLAGGAMHTDTLAHLDATYHFSTSPNVEILSRFIQLGLKSKYEPAVPLVRAFLGKYGRGLYVKPAYKALIEYDKKEALAVFEANKNFYHVVIRSAIAGFLGLK